MNSDFIAVNNSLYIVLSRATEHDGVYFNKIIILMDYNKPILWCIMVK